MSFIWRLFRSEKPPDDETVLAALASDIHRRQTLLSEIRARERTASTLVTLYTLAAWLAYVGVWYFGFVSGGRGGRTGGVERAARALPVFVGPILILFIRRIVQIWYARKGNAEEKTLQTLLKAQRTKVEEIKKKTNFYETRELLSRYDRDGGGSAPPSGGGGPGSVSSPNTPQRGSVGPGQGMSGQPNGKRAWLSIALSIGAPLPSATGAGAGGPAGAAQAIPPPPSQQPRGRSWFDALADVLVGPDDTLQIEKEKQKFALICGKCFAHNGLVPEGIWGDAQYTCPKCGHFNPSARSRGLLGGSGAAASSRPAGQSPTSPSPLSQPPATPVSIIMPPPAPTQTSSAASRPGGSDVRRRAPRDGGEEAMEIDS
ncbi:Protein lunapark [Mycena sanguinolenta]|uniref:Endoplasmic reticulum junction formation protein lunapark n=1 Tax=Mycena sanguinolenta TaxID=230812 RepID=A0A8H6ZCV4_9AGAR|nr:Protein lunapark [Mycena sanguinolenta]